MKPQYPLFSQVALTEYLPQYQLKRGNIATIVEHYHHPEFPEDGYILEGFDVSQIIIKVTALQIIPLSDYLREEAILSKFRNLSKHQQKKLKESLDFLWQKDQTGLIKIFLASVGGKETGFLAKSLFLGKGLGKKPGF